MAQKKIASSQPFVDAMARKYKNELRARMPLVPLDRPTGGSAASSSMDELNQQLVGVSTDKVDQSFMEKLGDETSGPGKIIDVISQPLYAVAQHAAETGDAIEREGIAKGLFGIGKDWNFRNPLSAEASNLGTGNQKHNVSDLLRDEKFDITDGDQERTYSTGNDVLAANDSDDNWNKAAKIAGSLGVDIAADPLSYIPGPAFVAAGKAGAKVIAAPVKLAQAAKEGTAIRAAGDAVAGAAARSGETLGRAAEKVNDAGARFSATTVGKPLAATARGIGTVLSPLHSLGVAIEKGVAKKAAKTLAEETGEFTEAAAKLGGGDLLEDILNKAAARQGLGEELATVAAKTGDDVAEVAKATPEAVRDAAKIAEGSFMPKVKVAANPIQGPKKALLKDRSGRTRAYDETLTSLLAKSKADDAELMYPKLGDLEKLPFTQFGKPKPPTPKEAAEAKAAEIAARYVEPEPGAVDDTIEQLDDIEEDDFDLIGKDLIKDPELVNKIKAKRKEKTSAGVTWEQHYGIVMATPSQRKELITRLWAGSGAAPSLSDVNNVLQSSVEALQRLKAGVPDVPGMVPVRPTTGLVAEKATPTAPKVDEVVEKVADKANEVKKVAEVKAADKVKKPDIRMWSGKVKQQYVQKLITEYGVHPAHVAELMSSTSKAGFAKKLKNMKTWKTTGEPQYKTIELIVESPANFKPTILDDAKPGVITASEQMDNGVAGAKTAKDIEADAAKGLSEETLKAWQFAMSDSPVTQNWTGIDESLKWKSLIEETLRTNPNLRQGYGVNREAANAKFQANVFRSLINDGSQAFKATGITDVVQRSSYLREFVIKGISESDDALRSLGIQPVATLSKSGWPVSLGDVLKAIESVPEGKLFLDGRVFDGFGKTLASRFKKADDSLEGTLKVDALLESVRPILDLLFRDVPELNDLANLKKTIKGIASKGFTQEVISTVRKEAQSLPITSLKAPTGGGKYEVKTLPAINAEKVSAETVDILLNPKVINGIFQAAHNNAASAGIVFGQRVNAITEEAIATVVRILGDPNAGTRKIAETISAKGKTKNLAEAKAVAEVGKTDALIDAVSAEKYDELLTEIVSSADMRAAEYLVEISRAVEKGEDVARRDALFQNYKDAVSEGFHTQTVATLMKSGENAATAMNSGIARLVQPLASRFFNGWGNPTIHAAMLEQGNVGRVFQGVVRKNLAEVARKFDQDQLVEGMRLLQRGIPVDSAGEAGEAARALQDTVDALFRISPEGSATQVVSNGIHTEFMAKGFDVDHITMKMEHGRLAVPEKFRFDKTKAAADAKANGTTVAHELSTQWTKWDIDDPISFLAQMTSVMGGLATDASISMEGLRIAKGLNLASDVPRKGMVRYIPDPKHNVLSKYFPEGTYFDKSIIPEFKRMDEILSESADVHWFLNNVMSPITQRWKAGMTIYHPGHHIRNLIGDTVMSYLIDGVKSPVYYNRALRMMVGKNNIRGAYTEFDAIAAMRGVPNNGMAGGKHAAKVRINGRTQLLSDDEVQRMAMNHGILPDFAVQEDIVDAARSGKGSGFAQGVDKVFDKKSPFKGKIRKVAGKLSEARDDYVRMAHFMHCLEHPPKGGFKTLDDAVEYAAARVRKAHPDGSDLTGMERQLRILFPFYSWTRKAIPLIVESILIHPGRVTTYPKAMYAFAQANGMDLESMTEPFPADQLYPSFLRDNMTGPLFRDEDGNDIGMDFGFPQADVLNDMLAPKGAGVVNMLNPLVKGPIEASTGGRIGSQADVPDTLEYIEGNIPGLAQAAQLTGYSPLKTIKNGEPTVQRSVEKGNKMAMGTGPTLGFDREALLNRTLNMRYTNYEKPSYKNIAEIEKRDAASAAREKLLKEMGLG